MATFYMISVKTFSFHRYPGPFGFQPMEVGGANRHRAAAKWGDIPRRSGVLLSTLM